ncbi:MAG: winged helix DNA-binding domain-containing protein [Chloroflexi bacterium]|nr:winged helix DNA-binding domain-containing protein [Chloroflexota bacterium]
MSYLGAIQAQDYLAAKWAVGQRLWHGTDAAVEKAFTDGKILRTHVLRPTWHFVVPADIRWMLELTGPSINARSAYYHRRLELDDAAFSRSRKIITRALQGGKHLTRSELADALSTHGIAVDNLLRLAYIIGRAESDGIVCSGPRHGKQFTYALLDERVPATRTFQRDEALAELAKRYFSSRGPATLQDFVWWSGLPASDAKVGLELVQSQLGHEHVDDKKYWFRPDISRVQNRAHTLLLLPNFDEYIVGYTDRSLIFETTHTPQLDARANPLFQHTIAIDGKIVGTWKREIHRESVKVTPKVFQKLTHAQGRALAQETVRYGGFLELVDVLMPQVA